eukprot:TRINITY_DN8281_c0_g1_i1.p1 TRINITY_DN8281_c0_g1~~TRINITY_DN8281_c0_g1_i1.p1  ORF type:complete len:230 (-),score=39.47 TRINITY_DN8281_c0_g1_i1:163-852(-)
MAISSLALFVIIVLSLIILFLLILLYQKGLYPSFIQGKLNVLFFYPQLWFLKANYKCGFNQNPWNWVDENLLLGSMPIEPHCEKLANLGVGLALNMCWIYDPEIYFRQNNIEQLRLPTIDHCEPSLQFLNRGVEAISKAVNEGKKVYVFCKGGHGRSAAVAFCWLLKTAGKNLEETQKMISSKRRVRHKLFKQENIKTFYYLLQSPKLEDEDIEIDDEPSSKSTTKKLL